MRCYLLIKPAAAVLLGGLLSCARADEPKDQERQIETTSSPPPKTDGQFVEKDFLDHFNEGSKYFQDIYAAQTSPEKLEFGHVRESPDDWEQRFEKIDLNKHRHQGKVRWGDKFGGYGEHYFDLNHGGGEKEKLTQKTNRSSEAVAEDPARDRRNLLGNGDVEFISDAARERIIAGATGMHGGNYKTDEVIGRVKRQDPAEYLDALAQE